MDDPLREAESRLERYWNVDGLHEIGVALILAMTATWVWATDISELPRTWKNAASAAFPLLLCGGIFAETHVVKAIRRRLTYPRAGFAQLRKPHPRQRIVAAALGAIVAAGTAFAVTRFEADLRRWGLLLLGVGMGAFLWQIGRRAGVPRFRAVAALVAASSVAIAGAGWSLSISMVVFWSVSAAAMLTSGGITLWRFLRS